MELENNLKNFHQSATLKKQDVYDLKQGNSVQD